MGYAHPIAPIPPSPPPGFVTVEHTMCPDRSWHFALALPESASLFGDAACAPSAGDRTATLAVFVIDDDARGCEIEVIGHLLADEIDPADWLDRALQADGYELLSRAPERVLGGVIGDVVARWRTAEDCFVARLFATKWGARLVAVFCRAREADYAAWAEGFLAISASLELLEPAAGAFAEDVVMVETDVPRPWGLALPESWGFSLHSEAPEGAWIEANHLAPTPDGAMTRTLDGRLALAVMTRSAAKRPRDAGNLLLRALQQNDIHFDSIDFVSDEPPEGFSHCWTLATPITRHEARGELHCRVMMSDVAWVVGGVLGPSRDADHSAWMRNKRVLDVATSTLEVHA